MKKLLIAFSLMFALSVATPIYAQTVDNSDTPTIASLQSTIVQLLEQLIAQLEAQIASQTQTINDVSSKVDTVIQNTAAAPIVYGNLQTSQVASAPAPSPTVPSLPACADDGHGSIRSDNCVIVSPIVVQGGTTTVFTITASPYTFPPVTNMIGFGGVTNVTVSSDNSTMTYTAFVPALRSDQTQANFFVSLDDGLTDANGNHIGLSHPFLVSVTQ